MFMLTFASMQAHVTANAGWVDYLIIGLYFVVTLGIGFVLRRRMRTSNDFFLSGRSLPSWVTGLAFVGANLGALEILGMGANAAQYGILQAHFYWIGAIPAMIFVAIFMMPFYYGSKTHSVPGFLKLRYNEATRGFNAITFGVLTLLTSGINMFAAALVFNVLLGWSLTACIWLSALFIMVYILPGGLSSSIYNETLQFFPILAIAPGLIILSVIPGLGHGGGFENSYNMAIPFAMAHYFPSGILGLGLTALLAAFMSGMAGNVTAFNTVWTYDIYRSYIRRDAPDTHYLWMGRVITVVGIILSVGTAYIAGGFNSIMDYVQVLFSVVNAPLLATFLLGMFWRRTTPWGGFIGLLIGTLSSLFLWAGEQFLHLFSFGSSEGSSMWRALIAFLICFVVTIVVSLLTKPKPDAELKGLVYSLTPKVEVVETVWYKRPLVLAGAALVILIVLNIIFF